MTTASTTLLGLALPVTGELSGTWGEITNDSITSLLDSAVAGTTTLSSDADVTLTTTTLAANTARQAVILWTAGGTDTRYITAPARSKAYIVINKSSSTQSIVLRGDGAPPTTGVTIVKGESAICAWNGSDFVKVSNASGAGVFTSVTDSGLTPTRVTYATTGGLLTDSANLTFNGTTLTAAGFSGPLGAVTPATGAFTTLSSTGNTTLGDASTDTVTVNGYMGVGGAATADRSINILGTSTASNTTQEGVRSAFTANSTATSAVRGFISVPTTQAAAFTVTDVAGFWAANASLGAGSTITNAHGLYIANQTQGTNNYGITSLVSSGTNKYNIYASGTAQNYFAGNVGIGTSSPTATAASTTVTQITGTSGELRVTGAAPTTTQGLTLLSNNTDAYVWQRGNGFMSLGTNNAERARIDANGNLGIGTTSPETKLEVAGSVNPTWTMTGDISGTTMTISAVTSGTIAVGDLVFASAIQPYTRVTALGTGTGGIGTYTVSVSQTFASATIFGTTAYGNTLIRITDTDTTQAGGQPNGGLQFYTSDASAPTAGVGAYVVGLAEQSTPDTALVFGTRDNAGGGIDANERVRIDSSGNVLIGTTTSPAGSKELVLGGDYIEGVVAIGNSATAKTISLANGTVQTVTLTGNCTFTMPTAVAGKSFTLILSTGAGSFTSTFTSVKWPNNTAPTITTTASRWDILSFISDGTNWYGNFAQAYQ